MKEFYKSFLLNLNEEETRNQDSYENIINILEQIQNRPIEQRPDEQKYETNSDNRFDPQILEYDNLENPFLVNNKRNFRYGDLNRLFVSSDNVDLLQSPSSFNTDTQIEVFGSLRIWQIAAILIAFVMFIGLAVFLFRRINKVLTQYSPSVLVASSNLENLRGCSVRSAYSTDSTSQLLAKNFSMKPNTRYETNPIGDYRKQSANFV